MHTQSLPYTFELKWKRQGGISALVCDVSGSLPFPVKGKVMLPCSPGISLWFDLHESRLTLGNKMCAKLVVHCPAGTRLQEPWRITTFSCISSVKQAEVCWRFLVLRFGRNCHFTLLAKNLN